MGIMVGERVSVTQCGSYQPELVDAAVRKAVDQLGGMDKFVSPGQRVLLKVNLLSSSPPEKAIVTHPSVVAAVAKLVSAAGGQPIIGDSPGGAFTKARLEQIYRKAGLYEVAEETGAVLNFDVGFKHVSNPRGHLMKQLDVISVLDDVDVVIGLPKLKTHSLLTFTGATKILFGVIPGRIKLGYHGKLVSKTHFAEMLLDIIEYVKPALMVMDAIVGMEGNGPAAGDPREIGLVLAGADCVAMDVVAASVVGIDPLSIPTIRAAAHRGDQHVRLRDIEVVGAFVEQVKVQGFKLAPKGFDVERLPGFLRNVLVNQLVLNPVPSPQRCRGCGVCVGNCPTDAIKIDNRLAKIEREKCIRCYCCHELCPETAIDLKQQGLARWLGR
jgi:uncharacterized protein (DUF362 family)/Pyruvate/2-oxoacid:ferredoxin oxidoreductase delta subunit